MALQRHVNRFWLTPKRDHTPGFFCIGTTPWRCSNQKAIFPNYNAPINRRAADGDA
jgi:hypothetical protein